jgi:hypothetical protein
MASDLKTLVKAADIMRRASMSDRAWLRYGNLLVSIQESIKLSKKKR